MAEAPILLSCIKTGRWWRCASQEAAARAAWRLGLKDYEISGEHA